MAQWCLDFGGVNDYAACGDVPTGGLDALTVECWLRLDAAEAGAAVAKWGGGGLNSEWLLSINSDRTVTWFVKDANGVQRTATSAALTLGQWYHVAGVYDVETGATQLYVDGALADSDPADAAVTNTAQAVEFGRLGANYASTRLGWVRISDVARYAGTFEPPRSPAFPDVNTLAQWDFIEGTGTGLNNREGTAAYDAVVSGATWRWDAPDRADLWGGAYERFGDAWTVLIDDVDRTDVVALTSMEIVEEIGSNRDTAVFRMEDVAASAAPGQWEHVQIWHGGTLVFGGFVVATDKMPNGITMDVVLHCVDWTALLDKRVIAERAVWTNKTAKTILKDITEAGYVTEFDATTKTADGATGLDVENDYGYVGDLVRKLADASGYYWFVREDEEGTVYLYFNDAVAAAPFALSTAPDLAATFPLRVLQWSESGSDIVNHFFSLISGEPGATAYTTGGTLGDVNLIDDRRVNELINSASVTAYGWLEARLEVGPGEEGLYPLAYLTALGEPRVAGRIEIRFPGGLRPGMTIDVEHSVLDVDDSFLIHALRTRPLGGGSVRYELTVSNWTRQRENRFSTALQKMQNRIQTAQARSVTDWVKRA